MLTTNSTFSIYALIFIIHGFVDSFAALEARTTEPFHNLASLTAKFVIFVIDKHGLGKLAKGHLESDNSML